jgi:probable HAF family extracellular repeat protein
MRGLGDLPGGDFRSVALGVSADGSVVVGRGSSDAGQEAFIWDGARGMRNLQEVLVKDYGLGAALAGWTLKSAKAISADGTSIVGYGINPAGQTEAWRAVIPAPAPDRAADRRPHGARRLGPDLVASAVR